MSQCVPSILPKDPTHPVQIALRTYALALSLSLSPSLLPFIVALLLYPINVKNSFTKTNFASLRRILRRELGHDGFAFSVTLSVAGGAAIRDLFRTASMYNHQLDKSTRIERYDSDGSRIGAVTTTGIGPSRSVQRLLQLLKGCLSYTSPEQQTFISNVISSFIGILLLQAGRARTHKLRAASKPTKQSGTQLDYTSPTLDLTLLLLVRAVDSIVQTFILQISQSIVGRADNNNTPSPGNQPVSKEGSSRTAPLATGRQHSEPHLLHDKLEKEKCKKDVHKIRFKLISRLDAFVFWACSARSVFNKLLLARLPPSTTICINRIMWCFFYEPYR